MRVVPALLLSSALFSQTYTIVDVQNVPANGDFRSAILTATAPAELPEISCDILIAGAGVGGVAGALRALDRGHSVCLAEETDVVGGQLHSVPALDEHKFIEISGGSRSYHQFRNRIREHYRKTYQLAPAVARLENFNPGACYVSSLCFEPQVGASILNDMLKVHGGKLQLLLRTKPVDARIENGRVQSVLAYKFSDRTFVRIRTQFVLDATEWATFFPLSKFLMWSAPSRRRTQTSLTPRQSRIQPACKASRTRLQSITSLVPTTGSPSPRDMSASATASRSVFA